jgi:hypothetical protein
MSVVGDVSATADSRIDLRIFWFLLAIAAIGLSLWTALDSAAQLSDCEVVMPSHGITTRERCWSPVHAVFGVWPMVGVAAVSAGPAAVAAVVLRKWISWSAALAYAVMTAVGITASSRVTRSLTLALPLTVIALIIATVQQRHS